MKTIVSEHKTFGFFRAAVAALAVVMAGGASAVTEAPAKFVEYIESDGYEYLDLGPVLTPTTVAVVDFTTVADNGNFNPFGAGPYTSPKFVFLTHDWAYVKGYYTTAQKACSDQYIGTRRVFKVDVPNQKLSVDGVDQGHSGSKAGSETGTATAYLFWASNGENKAKMKAYSCVITNDNALAMDLHPCVDRKGVACMYDAVSQTIFRDAVKTSSFKASETITLPPDAFTHDCLIVESTSDLYGADEVSPAYGAYLSLGSGESKTCTAPASLADPSGTLRLSCAGYKRYTYDTSTLSWVFKDEGEGNSVTCVNDGSALKLVWQWKRQYLVTTVTDGRGTVSASSWVDEGSSATFTATDGEGTSFYGWNADCEALGIDFGTRTASPTINGAVTLIAMFKGGEPSAKTYVGMDGGSWDESSNWSPAGVPSIMDDVTIPNAMRVAAGRRIFAHSVTLTGSAAISQGGKTTAESENLCFTDATSYGYGSYGRRIDDADSTTKFVTVVASNVTMSGSSQWLVGGYNSKAYKTVSIGGDLTMSGTALFAVYAGLGDMSNAPERGGATFAVTGKVSMASGTIIDANCNVNTRDTCLTRSDLRASGAYVRLDFGETRIDAGAAIRSRLGVGAYSQSALKAQGAPATSGNSLAGGGHGGVGGISGSTAGGKAYDYELAPILPGSFGSCNRTVGGGVVRLDTTNLVLNGSIKACAYLIGSQHERGQCSGGSVWITCDAYELGSAALIDVHGANGVAYNSYNIGGGAGGRIAIATGLTSEQKTALARTGTTEGISSATLIKDDPTLAERVNIAGGSGVLSGTAGGTGTAVTYRFLDTSKVTVTVVTSPTGLTSDSFDPSIGESVELKRNAAFSASAPEYIAVASGTRRQVTGWKATRGDGTTFDSGNGSSCSIDSVSENLTLTWLCADPQHSASVSTVGDGAVAGLASGWYDEGTVATLTATPTGSAAFRGWLSGRFLTEMENASRTLTVTVDRPLHVAALFTGTIPAFTAKTYAGASGGSWDVAENWYPSGVPDVTDAVTIPADTAVAVDDSAIAGSITLGDGATLSVYGATTDFRTKISIDSYHAPTTVGRYAASFTGTGDSPSVETVGDITLGANAICAVGGVRQRGCSVLRAYGNLTVGAGAKVSVYAGPIDGTRLTLVTGSGGVSVKGTVSLAAGSLLDLVGYLPQYSDWNKHSQPTITCGRLEIAEGATLNANLPYAFVPGKPMSYGLGDGDGVGGDPGRIAGAGHGGIGGASGSYAGGSAYDTALAPMYPGSMGRMSESMGSFGGGAMRVKAGSIVLNGTISADATLGAPFEAGGAAGGSIWLITESFRAGANAKLSAKGQKGASYNTYNCGGGAGGRIAICERLSESRLMSLMTNRNDKAEYLGSTKSLYIADQTVEGAKYYGIGDVSGGKATNNSSANAVDGAAGTFLWVRPRGLMLIVR